MTIWGETAVLILSMNKLNAVFIWTDIALAATIEGEKNEFKIKIIPWLLSAIELLANKLQNENFRILTSKQESKCFRLNLYSE